MRVQQVLMTIMLLSVQTHIEKFGTHLSMLMIMMTMIAIMMMTSSDDRYHMMAQLMHTLIIFNTTCYTLFMLCLERVRDVLGDALRVRVCVRRIHLGSWRTRKPTQARPELESIP